MQIAKSGTELEMKMPDYWIEVFWQMALIYII